MKAIFIAATLALALTQGGCFWFTTKHEGKTLRTDVDALQKRVDTELGAKVSKLEKVLDDATKLLARNSADLGAEVNGLVQENAKLTGLVMEAKRYSEEIRKQALDDQKAMAERVEALEARLASLEKAGTAAPKKTAQELYDEGKVAFDAGKWAAAQTVFKNFVLAYPNDAKAADAQYMRAETHYQERDWRPALGEFQKVFEKYSKSELADDALFRAGEAAEQLKWCTDARAYFGLVRQRYPKSPLAKKAKTKDATLKKNATVKTKCVS